jgi:hypothetical protein
VTTVTLARMLRLWYDERSLCVRWQCRQYVSAHSLWQMQAPVLYGDDAPVRKSLLDCMLMNSLAVGVW